MSSQILEKAAVVIAGIDQSVEYTPDDGEEIFIKEFKGSAPESAKASICLFWDFGGANEKLLWTITQDQGMPSEMSDRSFVGDGIKKIAMVLSNGCTSDYNMSGVLELKVDL